jgi:hypothetical protein
MGSIATTSFSSPLPEGLQDVSIEFMTGFAASPECGEEVISIAVPQGVQLPVKPGCETGTLQSVGERAKEWLQGIIR